MRQTNLKQATDYHMLPCKTHILFFRHSLRYVCIVGALMMVSVSALADEYDNLLVKDFVVIADLREHKTTDTVVFERNPRLPSDSLPKSSLPADSLQTDSLRADTMQVDSAELSLRANGFPVLQLKTNILFDAALTPNIEVEIPIGYHPWSILAEWWFPWYVWRRNGTTNAYSFMMAGAELRYWIRQNESAPGVMKGHFVGIYGAGGLYDFQLAKDGHGYQGEFGSGGFTYGYAITPAKDKKFHMEFSIGVGYMGGPQRAYKADPRNDHLVLLDDRHFWYLGPTKLKISIGYLFHIKNK